MHDAYKKIETPEGISLHRCPVCAFETAIWRFSESPTDPTTTTVMCSNGEKFGPQSGMANEGCLLYMPPDDFYHGTIRDAVKYWNEYATALNAIRATQQANTEQSE